MDSGWIGALVTLLIGVLNLVLTIKKENKGLMYKIIVGILWLLFAIGIIVLVGKSIEAKYQLFYVIVILSIFIVVLIVLCIIIMYKNYKMQKMNVTETNIIETSATETNAIETSTTETNVIESEISSGITVFTSNKDYNENINPLELNATEIITLTKRVNIVFKPDMLIHEIAESRFGHESFEIEKKNNYDIYVEAHKIRKRAFLDYLDAAKPYYELYCATDLKQYLRTFYHNGVDNLDKKYLKEELIAWMETIRKYDNYHVIICEQEGVVIPIKYKIYDRKIVVIHDSVGAHPQNRVNSYLISDEKAVKSFVKDFEVLWQLANPQKQTSEYVCNWIKCNLIDKIEEKYDE